MYWGSVFELDLSLSLLALIVSGLMTLRYSLTCSGVGPMSFMVLATLVSNGGVCRSLNDRSDEDLLLDLLSSESMIDVLCDDY